MSSQPLLLAEGNTNNIILHNDDINNLKKKESTALKRWHDKHGIYSIAPLKKILCSREIILFKISFSL